MFTSIIIFIVVLGLLVFVHELGHFLSARRFGINVEEFGFGFPPRIFGWKRGETLYSINWIPLGGFVKIKGETGSDSSDKDSFAARKPWQRVTVLLAGVMMNMLLAWALFSFGFVIGLPQEISDQDLARYKVRDLSILITQVEQASPAEQAGLEPGDSIVKLDDFQPKTANDVVNYIEQNNQRTINFGLKRGGDDLSLQIKPEVYADHDKPLAGIAVVRTGIIRYNPLTAIINGFRATTNTLIAVVAAFYFLLVGLLSGTGVGDQIQGPIGVAVLTSQVAKLGFIYLINFTAVLSINLGFLNIIPFPALDGGRVLFVILEKIKGRPVSQRLEMWFHNVGFSLLILLILFITYRDVIRYGGDIWQGVLKML